MNGQAPSGAGVTDVPASIDHNDRAWPHVAAVPISPIERVTRALQSVWREHRVLLIIATLYIVAGGQWLSWQGAAWHLTWGYPLIWQMWFVLTTFWWLWEYLRHPDRLWRILTIDRVVGAVVVLALLAPFQSTFQSLKNAIPGFPWDRWLSDIDIAIHGGAPWTWWQPSDRMLAVIDGLYAAWFLMLVAFVSWVSWSGHRVLRARALVSAALLWIFAGTVAAWLLSSAGPCYYARVADGPNPYSELAARIDGMQLFANGAQRRLWAWRMDGTYGATSGISAMPSMHVAMAVLVAIVAWRRWKPLGVVCWLYAGAIQVGSVVLAWHYAVDGYVGALLAALCWYAAKGLIRPDALRPAAPR
jgi:membrane-associated phospholipid phosphatase